MIPFIDWSRAPLGTTHANVSKEIVWTEHGVPAMGTRGWEQIFPDRIWEWHDRFGWCHYAELVGHVHKSLENKIAKPYASNCVHLNYKLLHKEACVPECGTEHSAGYDICYAYETGIDFDLDLDAVEIEPGEIIKISTGLAFETPAGVAMLILPRSGMATKQQLRPANTPGLIDPDYRGELLIALENFGTETQVIRHGDRIAQMLLVPFFRPILTQVKQLSETVRGAGGFGSTGIFR